MCMYARTSNAAGLFLCPQSSKNAPCAHPDLAALAWAENDSPSYPLHLLSPVRAPMKERRSSTTNDGFMTRREALSQMGIVTVGLAVTPVPGWPAPWDSLSPIQP